MSVHKQRLDVIERDADVGHVVGGGNTRLLARHAESMARAGRAASRESRRNAEKGEGWLIGGAGTGVESPAAGRQLPAVT